MEPFFDPAAIPPTTPEAAATAVGFAGQATFNGCVALASMTAAEAARLLPPALEPLPGASLERARHPGLVVFGEQTEGTWLFGGLSFPLGTRYMEVAVLVPLVRPRAGGAPAVFVAAMWSGYFPATWHGNAHYGFAKAPAVIRQEGPLFVVTSPDGRLLLHAAVEPRGAWMPAGHADLPAVRAVQALLALPVLGRLADGRLVRSRFEWSFADALVRPADARVSVDAPAAEGLLCGDWPDLPAGTFEVRGMRWRLAWPQ